MKVKLNSGVENKGLLTADLDLLLGAGTMMMMMSGGGM